MDLCVAKNGLRPNNGELVLSKGETSIKREYDNKRGEKAKRGRAASIKMPQAHPKYLEHLLLA